MTASDGDDRMALSTASGSLETVVDSVGVAVGERYVLLDQIGVGGSAVVHTAYDRKLDRKVALKLLRAGAREAMQARLLREAQALARLRHPNVVTVHDVGTFGDRVFIAMELIVGCSLRSWLAERPRTWREVVKVFLAAGRGLAAAHAHGLVHRDFKPDNVLIDQHDGSVRVADFGLARQVGASDRENRSPDPSALAVNMTRDGAVVGTPRYMSPEQHRGEAVDARADQFAFCVALWEALSHQLPYSGATLGKSTVDGDDTLAGMAQIPRRIRAALQRGLSRQTENRFAKMDELLDVLAHDPAVRRRRVLIGVAALATALALLLAARRSAAPADPCAGGESALAGTWDPAVKAAVRAAFVAVPSEYAADTFDRAEARIDGYVSEWLARRREVCQATAVRHEQSEALLDRRMACLDARRDELRALTALWIRAADASVIDRAVGAAARLEDLRQCVGDEGGLDKSLPADPSARAQIAGLRARVDEIHALLLAGKYQEAKSLAPALVTDAEKSEYPPVLLAALKQQHTTDAMLRDYKDQEATMRRELILAARLKQDALVVHLWSTLISLVGYYEKRPDEALAMQEVAETAVARAGGGDAERAELLNALGFVYVAKEEFPLALRKLHEAVALQETLQPPDEIQLAAMLNAMGICERRSGRPEVARAHFQRVLEIYQRVVGPQHPFVAGAAMNLGNTEADQSRWSEAHDLFERAIAIWNRSSPNGADLAGALVNLARSENGLGQPQPALEHAQRSLAIKERVFGPESPNLGSSLQVEACALIALERREEARAALVRAAALLEKNGTPASDYALVLTSQASFALAEHQPAEAVALATRALVIDERIAGPASADFGSSLLVKGEAEVALGRPVAATSDLERALMLVALRGLGADELANAHFALAQARWQIAHDDPFALPLAQAARARYATSTPSGARHVAEVNAWLAGKR